MRQLEAIIDGLMDSRSVAEKKDTMLNQPYEN
jgi:hypothetical protein